MVCSTELKARESTPDHLILCFWSGQCLHSTTPCLRPLLTMFCRRLVTMRLSCTVKDSRHVHILLTWSRTGFNIIPAYSEFFHLDTLSKSLLTACYFIGAIVSSGVAPMICNKLGRKNTIFVSVLIKFLGIILMSTSQNFGMFIAGRIILGAGSGVSGTATPTYAFSLYSLVGC